VTPEGRSAVERPDFGLSRPARLSAGRVPCPVVAVRGGKSGLAEQEGPDPQALVGRGGSAVCSFLPGAGNGTGLFDGVGGSRLSGQGLLEGAVGYDGLGEEDPGGKSEDVSAAGGAALGTGAVNRSIRAKGEATPGVKPVRGEGKEYGDRAVGGGAENGAEWKADPNVPASADQEQTDAGAVESTIRAKRQLGCGTSPDGFVEGSGAPCPRTMLLAPSG